MNTLKFVLNALRLSGFTRRRNITDLLILTLSAIANLFYVKHWIFARAPFLSFDTTTSGVDSVKSILTVFTVIVSYISTLRYASSLITSLPAHLPSGYQFMTHFGSILISLGCHLYGYFVEGTPNSLLQIFMMVYETYIYNCIGVKTYFIASLWNEEFKKSSRNAENPIEAIEKYFQTANSVRKSLKTIQLEIMLMLVSSFLNGNMLLLKGAKTFINFRSVKNDARKLYYMEINEFMHFILLLSNIALVASAGQLLHKEVFRTTVNLHSEWWRIDDINYHRKLCYASLQLYTQPFQVKLFGIMSLDNSIIFIVVSSSFTFMVALLQLSRE